MLVKAEVSSSTTFDSDSTFRYAATTQDGVLPLTWGHSPTRESDECVGVPSASFMLNASESALLHHEA
jgi:hypothetical protein